MLNWDSNTGALAPESSSLDREMDVAGCGKASRKTRPPLPFENKIIEDIEKQTFKLHV